MEAPSLGLRLGKSLPEAGWVRGRMIDEGSQSQQMRQQHVLSLKGKAGKTREERVMSE